MSAKENNLNKKILFSVYFFFNKPCATPSVLDRATKIKKDKPVV